MYDQNKPSGFDPKSMWGYLTTEKWVKSLYTKYPAVYGRVNHIGTSEDTLFMSPFQRKKLRDHLQGRVRFRTGIVCSFWGQLLGNPDTAAEYFVRARDIIGQIIVADDIIDKVELYRLGRVGRPQRPFLETLATY